MATEHDQDYLRALCQGSSAGLQALYRRYTPDVRRWVLQNNGSEDDAKDLFQDALMAIYDRYCGGGFEFTGSFGGLLLTICRRKWYDRLKEKNRESDVRNTEAVRYEDEAATSDHLVQAEEALAHQRRQEGLSRAFAQLTEQCRQLLTLLKEDLPGDEVAARLGLSNANAVYQSKHRCLGRWRQLFYQQSES